MALTWLNKELKTQGFEPVSIDNLKLQDTSTRRVDILLNSDY